MPSRLEAFEGIRRGRASAVTIFSNAAQDEADKIREAASEFVQPVERIPSKCRLRADISKIGADEEM